MRTMGKSGRFNFPMWLDQPTILAGRMCCDRNGEDWRTLLSRLFRVEIRRLDRAGKAGAPVRPLRRKALPSHLASSSNPSVMYGPGGLAENTAPTSTDPPTT